MDRTEREKKENRKCSLREGGFQSSELHTGRRGRGRCIGYNLSHMAHLKKATSRFYNHCVIALGHISEHIKDFFCLIQMSQKICWCKVSSPRVCQGLVCEKRTKNHQIHYTGDCLCRARFTDDQHLL